MKKTACQHTELTAALPDAGMLLKAPQRNRRRNRHTLPSTACILLAVAAALILAAALWLPLLQICGTSMTPTLTEGEIVLAWKNPSLQQGDIIAFYADNRILVKRIIAGPGSQVTISRGGTVTVDGQILQESYLTEKALGICDIEMPFQVPDDQFFVMGDHRSDSVDSRSTLVGCVTSDQIVGEIIYRVWPLSTCGKIQEIP